MSIFYKKLLAETLEKNNVYTLFLDLDGVLVDYTNGFRQLFKKKHTNSIKVVEKEYFNDVIGFWENLEWVRGGREIYDTSIELFNRVHVLSSASTENKELLMEITEGKTRWCLKHLPEIPIENIHIVPGSSYKSNFSNKKSILIDDKDETIFRWKKKKGIGILHRDGDYQKSIICLQKICESTKLHDLI